MNNAEAVLMVLGETKAQLESQKDLNKSLANQLIESHQECSNLRAQVNGLKTQVTLLEELEMSQRPDRQVLDEKE